MALPVLQNVPNLTRIIHIYTSWSWDKFTVYKIFNMNCISPCASIWKWAYQIFTIMRAQHFYVNVIRHKSLWIHGKCLRQKAILISMIFGHILRFVASYPQVLVLCLCFRLPKNAQVCRFHMWGRGIDDKRWSIYWICQPLERGIEYEILNRNTQTSNKI